MDTPNIADIHENLNELQRLVDQSEVEKITLRLWRLFAMQLAKFDNEAAKLIISEICESVESQWMEFKESGSEAKVIDALSDFKAEASQLGFR